jgi:hypothetical protein
MALSFLYVAFPRLLQMLRLRRSERDELAIEIVMLCHEVAVLRRQVARPLLHPSDRTLLAGLSRLLSRDRWGRFFVQPETLLRWLGSSAAAMDVSTACGPTIAPLWNGSTCPPSRRGEPIWGYRRIHGELATMGVRLAPSSVWEILRRHGIDPAPKRTGQAVG